MMPKFIQVPDGEVVAINQIICFDQQRLSVWGRTVPIDQATYDLLRDHVAVLTPMSDTREPKATATCALCGSPDVEGDTAGCKDCNDYAEDVVGLREALLQHVFIPPIPGKKL